MSASGSSESRGDRKHAHLHHSGATLRPAAKRHVPPGSAHPDPEQERDSSPQRKVRTGIVSVNGRDVGEMHCTGGRHTA